MVNQPTIQPISQNQHMIQENLPSPVHHAHHDLQGLQLDVISFNAAIDACSYLGGGNFRAEPRLKIPSQSWLIRVTSGGLAQYLGFQKRRRRITGFLVSNLFKFCSQKKPSLAILEKDMTCTSLTTISKRLGGPRYRSICGKLICSFCMEIICSCASTIVCCSVFFLKYMLLVFPKRQKRNTSSMEDILGNKNWRNHRDINKHKHIDR